MILDVSLLILMITSPHYLDCKSSCKKVPSHDKFAQGPVQQNSISALTEEFKNLLSRYVSQTSTFMLLMMLEWKNMGGFFNISIQKWKAGLKQGDGILAGSP